MVRTTWPLLLAAALGLVPFTIFSNFLVDIAADAHGHSSTIGSFRGLGGIAAVIVGVLCAPLIDAIPRQRLINLALATLGLGCALSVVSHTSTWIAFCLIIGAGTAVLNPAISAQASDTFHNDAEAGRAATLVSSTMTLTAMLAAPILAGPALIWGWQGNMIVVAITCLLTVAIISRRRAHQTSITAHTERQDTTHTTHNTTDSAPPADIRGNTTNYLASFTLAARTPAALPLLGVSMLRTAAFMGQLAFVAVFYHDHFGLSSEVFTWVWSLSGLSFFLGNWFGGKALKPIESPGAMALVMTIASLSGTGAVYYLFHAPHLIIALACTSLVAISHAVIAACVTTILVRQSHHRGTILSLNGVGQSIGVCVGASLAGIGLQTASWHGAGLSLGITTLVAAILSMLAGLHLRHHTTSNEPGDHHA